MTVQGLEGQVRIRLHTGSDRIRSAEVEVDRPWDASRAFPGRSPAELLRLIPLAFGVCGTAQTRAALGALEDAAGCQPGAEHRAARDLAVGVETAREHLVRILLGWPGPGAGPVRETKARRAHTLPEKVRAALYPGGDFACSGGGRLSPNLPALAEVRRDLGSLVEDAVLGAPASDFLSLRDLADLEEWRTGADPETAAVQGLDPVRDPRWAGWGASELRPLPELSPAALAGRLEGDRDGGFCALPEWDGEGYETTPLTRQRRHPLVAAALAESGSGLFARRLARLVELADVLAGWPHPEADLAALGEDERREETLPPGTGLGRAEAARGRLYHWATVEGDRVTGYRILAPTEWNFHPSGPVARGLAGATLEPGADPREAARILAEAVDPCVACRIEVADA